MDLQVIQDLGFSQAETKIYLALLELGSSSTGKIIDKTKFQSSTVYHILGSLQEKGIVTHIFKGKIKFFQAEPPEVINSFIDEKKRRFQEIIPKLKEKQQISKKKQTAKVYEGTKGLQAAFLDILNTLNKGDTYYFFSAPKSKLFYKNLTIFFRNYHLKRAELGIQVKGLTTKESKVVMEDIFKDIKKTSLKYIDDFAPTGIVIYANKVITWDWDDIPTAIVIISESIAKSYKQFFEEKWKMGKKFS